MGENEKVFEGHEGHNVTVEFDMGGDWDEEFHWCNDCDVTVYDEEDESPVCGDWPAPCNCDDHEVHNGH